MGVQHGVTKQNFDAMSLGYAQGLLPESLIRHEQRVLEAHRLALHVGLSNHLNQKSALQKAELDKELQNFQRYVQRLLQFLRSPSPVLEKDLKRRFQRKPNRFLDVVRPLVKAFSA